MCEQLQFSIINSLDRYLAYRIASTTYFEKNTDVYMKMDMCMCAA